MIFYIKYIRLYVPNTKINNIDILGIGILIENMLRF